MEKNEKSTPIVQIISTADSTLSSPYFDISSSCDVSEEFTLADYFPEVRRVISVCAKAIPEGRFVSGNTIDCDGVVSFIITYLGEDSTIASAPFTVEYSQSIAFPDLPEGTDGNPCVCDTIVESSSCRVTDPRKISLKAHLRTRVFADMLIGSDEKYVDEKGTPISGTELLSVERCCESKKSMRTFSGLKSSSVTGNVRGGDIARAISADGAINIIDAHAHEGRVVVRGEAVVFILCQKNDGIYVTLREKEAFETEVDISEAKAGDFARAFGRAASVTVSSSTDGMNFEIEYDMEAQVMRPEEIALCADAYSTAYESYPVMCDREIYAPLKCSVLHLTQTGDIKRKSETVPGEYTVGMWASAIADKMDITDGKMTLSGTITVQASIAKNGEVDPEEGKIPFMITTDVSDTDIQNPVWRADIQVIDLNGRVGTDVISVGAELVISIFAVDRKRVSCVQRVVLDRSKPRKKASGVRIYFPDEGESIWSIAKKYSSCRRTLEKLNGWQEGMEKAGNSPVIIE